MSASSWPLSRQHVKEALCRAGAQGTRPAAESGVAALSAPLPRAPGAVSPPPAAVAGKVSFKLGPQGAWGGPGASRGAPEGSWGFKKTNGFFNERFLIFVI